MTTENNTSGQLLSPYDQRIYDIPAAEHERYKAAGWVPPATDVDDLQVHSTFNNWKEMGGVEAALYSGSAGWLGLPSAIEKGAHLLGRDDWAKNYADNVMMAAEQHPDIDLAARLTTGIGSASLYSAGAAMAAPALLGAAGLGVATEGVAAGGAALEGVLGSADAVGVAASAAGEGAQALSLGQRAMQAAPGVAKLGGKLAAEGAAIGIVSRYDQAAIQHAFSPEGQEKMVWGLSDIALDAAVNGTVGLGVTGGIKALSQLGKKMEGVSMEKLISSMLDRQSAEQVALQGRDGELRRLAKEVVPLGVERGRTYVDNLIDVAEKDMNQLKYQIEGKGNWLMQPEVAALKKKVNEHLGGSVEGARIIKMIEDASGNNAPFDSLRTGDPDGVLNVQKLQDIRKATYDMIRWESAGKYVPGATMQEGRAIDPKLKEVGHIFGDNIRKVFEKADVSLGNQYATDWALKDSQYSAAQLLKGALRKGSDDATFSQVMTKVFSSIAVGAALGGMSSAMSGFGLTSSAFGGGALGLAVASGNYKAIGLIKPIHFAHAGQSLGTVMSKADEKLGSAVLQNLRNSPVVARNVFSPAEYQQVAQKLSAIGTDPTTATANLNKGLTDAGLPDDMARDMAGKLMQPHQYLAEQIKTPAGPADIPSLSHGDPVKMRKIMGQYRTVQDPSHGINYPTQANLEVLKKFYPNTLLAVQQAVHQQVRQNPRMSSKAKTWASRVLQRPINNLSSSGFSAMLQQARAASIEAAKKAGGPSRGTSRRPSSEDTGSQTRLDELQGSN